jgi:hypothetical protein
VSNCPSDNTVLDRLPFSRVFGMPNADTFLVPPIGQFVRKYLSQSRISVDPFARNYVWTTYTNDLNPATAAQYHMDAEDFCHMLQEQGVQADLAIFDPPYSPRQIAECYAGVGKQATTEDTQNARLYRRVRDALDPLVAPDGIVLSFGWNSVGMGQGRNYDQIEVMLVAHGGAHNDTICLAERKRPVAQLELLESAA